MASIDFQIAGQRMVLEYDAVVAALSSVDPEPARSHVVEVGGEIFPVKQVFSAATGLDRLDFTTNQARSVLKRLGFEVVRVGAR